MPKDYIHETAITIDHELGTCRVDTTMRSVVSQLKRRGFKDITPQNNWPYRNFLGEAGQIGFRRTGAQRRASRGKAILGSKAGQFHRKRDRMKA